MKSSIISFTWIMESNLDKRIPVSGYRCLVATSLLLLALLPCAIAADGPTARVYHSPEERREAGVGHALTDWLTLSGLAEVEHDYSRNTLTDGHQLRGHSEASQLIQLGLEAEISEYLTAKAVYEYEFDQNHGRADEVLLEYEKESWSLSLGREYLNFGEYFSHFATDPLLQFGETRADALTVGYQVSSHLEVSGFVFDGGATSPGNAHSSRDYGVGLEVTSDEEALALGLGYLSDLAESDEAFLLESGHQHDRQVAALNAYLLFTMPHHEITAELIMALDAFAELEADIDKPVAWNLELAWMPVSRWQLAFRVEGSRELEDEPESQYGLSSSWLLGKHLYMSIEYLYGRYKTGFATDDDDNDLESRQSAMALVSLEF
jgi:hypothetical protein